MEDGQRASGDNVAAVVEQSQQALSKNPLPPDEPERQESQDPAGLSSVSYCYLVVYQPFLVASPPSFNTRGYAFVSCAASVSRIDLTVGLQDGDEVTRTRRFTCYNTSTCVGSYNALSPWGWWKTVASSSTKGWNDYRESSWTLLWH